MAWTDERLDDLSARMDAGFERVDGDLRELRGALVAQGHGLRDEMSTLRTELRGETALLGSELRAEIGDLRITLIRVGGGIMAGLVGVIAAVLLGS